ncbi:MAG: hypothetical protein AMJ79_02800 [Phycisphaerae bacterium SM23_30]|nr:MAG: hypothetical protein AMJ79_02800 [Phycisphaerae bacterium SM23_30]
MGSSDEGGADAGETLTITGTVGVNYYAKVSAWAGSTGAYQFDLSFTRAQQPDSYETNNSIDDAYVLTGNVLAGPTIHNDDTDYYDITDMVPEGTMSVEAYLYGSAGLDAGLALYVLDGDTESLIRSVNRAGINGNEVLKANIEDYSGQQLILAVNSVNDTTGRYSLELAYSDEDIGDFAEPNQQRTTAYAVTLNDSSRAGLSDLSLHNASDRDYYSFVAPADTDGTVFVTVTPDDAAVGLNVSLRLLNEEANVLKATDAAGAGDSESLTLNSVGSGLEAGHRYYIDVNGWGTVGNYQLNLRCPLVDTSYAQAHQNTYGSLSGYNEYPRFSTAYKFDGTPPEIRVIEQVANDNDDDLSFGAVPVGSSLSYTFEILNTGGSTLQIGAGDMTIVGDGSDVFSVDPSYADIVQGGSQEFTVTFTPAQLQLYLDTTLQIVSNDPDNNPYELALSGTGVVSADKPDIALVNEQNTGSLDSLAFGDVLVDGQSNMSLRIVNFGSASLTVSAVAITGDDADAFTNVFTNLPDKSSDNYTIAAGGQKLIQVYFNPTTDGLHNASMTLTSNDPDETSVVLPLTGAGVQPDLVVDLDPDDEEVANPLNYIIGFGNQVADGPGNQQAEYPIDIWNLGTSTLTISSISLEDGTDFSISGVSLSNLEIEPGEWASASVIFDPTAAGSSFTDTLTISSDDFDTPSMQFNLTGQASQAFSTTIEAGGSYEFTDSDGDSIKIELNNGCDLSAVVTFDGSTAHGSDIADISINGGTKSSTLTITVTSADGDNLVDVGDISIAGVGFGTVQVGGSVDSLTVAAAVKAVTLTGELGGFSADGVVVSFTTGGLSGTVGADAFKTISVNGNITGAQIFTDAEYKGSAIRTLNVTGNISDDTTINSGLIKNMAVTGSVNDTTITTSGAKSQVGTLSIGGAVDNLNINTAKMKSVSVNNDLLNSSFTLDSDKASLKALSVAGDADLNLAVSGIIKTVMVQGDLAGQIDATGVKGLIKSVNVGENLSAGLSAVKSIKTINAGANITSSAITILGTGKGSIGNLTVGGSLNVADIDVDGTIKRMTVGSTGSGDLSGNVSAGIAINKVEVFGDIFGRLEAGRKINTITARGDLKNDAFITCTEGNITKLFISDTILGYISANNGAGRIKQVLRPNSFADPDTGLVNSYIDHIDAQLAKINWKDS